MSGNPEERTDLTPAEAPSPPPSARRHQGTSARRRFRRAAIVIGGVAAAILALGLLAESGAGKFTDTVPAVPVVRGDLPVTVIQTGALWSTASFSIKDEVEGWSTILDIVDEGAVITQEDVDNGKVLIQLDSSSLLDTEANRSIDALQAEANYAQSKEDYEMRKKQNESDIAAAELNVKFARMDLERYLSAELVPAILDKTLEFNALGDQPNLGGEAEQSVRDLSAKVQLASEELARAKDQLEWSQRLFTKGYVSRNDLLADELANTRAGIRLDSAKQALELFKRYTLPKDAEQRYSDYIERQRDMARALSEARSKLAQAEATMKSSEATYRLDADQLRKTQDMVGKCTIRATKRGRITYGDTADPWQRRDNPIQEGVSVQQNQTLLQIPDPSKVAVRMNVPEADVSKLAVGQPAIITVEAIAGKTFTGRVVRISPMASSAQARLNPDKRVYETDVALNEALDDFIAGMSATAQIIVAQLHDVLYVPVQAVTTFKGVSFCWVKTPEGPQLRQVTPGDASEKFVEIRDGLHADEEVYLAPPEQASKEAVEDKVRDLEAAGKLPTAETTKEAPLPGEAPPSMGPPGQPAAQAGQPGQAAAQPGQPGQAAQGFTPEVRALMQQMRNATTDEERQKIRQQMMEQMTPEQRQQYESRTRAYQNMTPEERAQRRQQFGGAGGPGGAGAPAGPGGAGGLGGAGGGGGRGGRRGAGGPDAGGGGGAGAGAQGPGGS